MELNRRTLLGAVAALLASDKTLQAEEVKPFLLTPEQVKPDLHPFGRQRTFYQGGTPGLKSLAIGSLELKPGQEPHPPHTHPDEEIIVVTEGSGQIILDGTVSDVGPGAVMYVTPNYLHGIRNTGTSPLAFYYVKWVSKTA